MERLILLREKTISIQVFMNQTLQLNLFFLRIMKEHLIFIKASLTPKNADLGRQADLLRRELDKLLKETIRLANGVIRPSVLNSGEFVTRYTVSAERATAFYTGINIDTNITEAEISLGFDEKIMPNNIPEEAPFMLPYDIEVTAKDVFQLNKAIIAAVKEVLSFKEFLRDKVLACEVFTSAYPHLVEHVIDETKFYLSMLNRLQKMEKVNIPKETIQQEDFWNHIMGDHAEFIRGMLDTTEKKLIRLANAFAEKYEELNNEAKSMKLDNENIARFTDQSLRTTREFRDFKKQGVEGILSCKVKSIILPLLADHVLREANHYLRILRRYKAQ